MQDFYRNAVCCQIRMSRGTTRTIIAKTLRMSLNRVDRYVGYLKYYKKITEDKDGILYPAPETRRTCGGRAV